MALDGGGGGGGGPVGFSNSFTGAAEALEVIGEHIYGYSGQVAVADSEISFFEFTSGSYYTVVGLQVFNFSNSSDDMQYKVYLNDGLVVSWLPPTSTNLQEPPQPVSLVIPPYTQVKITGFNLGSSAGRNHTASITGRIYR